MLLFNILLTASTLFIYRQGMVNGLPLEPANLLERDVPVDDISMYTTQYFLERLKFTPQPSTCVFYTFGLSQDAIDFSRAGENVKTTIWDLWPCNLYNENVDDLNNPLRGLFSNSVTKQTYFENMSRAFASVCDVDVTLMTRDPANVPMNGIWGRVEFPTLTQPNLNFAGGLVNKVLLINRAGVESPDFWNRAGELKAVVPTNSTVRRQLTPAPLPGANHCFTDDQIPALFADINW